MIVSLRIMHFGFLISVIVAVLIIGIAREATAQGNEVECPCDFDSVRMTPGCWTDQREGDPQYEIFGTANDGECQLGNLGGIPITLMAVQRGSSEDLCAIRVRALTDCDAPSFTEIPITPEEVKACQCELLAYTTALNEVADIEVSGGPPYECGDVDCRPVILSPIPTLNEWGMIITAAVLGLLAVIGLFVIRRRKAVA